MTTNVGKYPETNFTQCPFRNFWKICVFYNLLKNSVFVLIKRF